MMEPNDIHLLNEMQQAITAFFSNNRRERGGHYPPFGPPNVTQNNVPLDLRFPGQFVNGTGIFHNGFRDYGKYTTPVYRSPSGDFQVHFYRSELTGEPYYSLDYKTIFTNGPFKR